MKRRGTFEGWILVLYAALFVAASLIAVFATASSYDAAVHLALRTTARTSLVIFLGIFAASPWNGLRPSSTSKWLLRNRRQLGVSFGISHLTHGALIVLGALTVADVAPPPVLVAVEGPVFLVIAAMVATSFDRTAAWIGKTPWRVLNTGGVYLLWFAFTFAQAKRVASQPVYALPLALLLGVLGARIFVFVRRALNRRDTPSPAPRCPASPSSASRR